MGPAIGQIIAAAIGVGLSPIPIIAVVLILVTTRARANAPAFLVGWVVGLAAIGVVVLAVLAPSGAAGAGAPSTWSSWLKIGLGILLLVVALRQWRSRPGSDDEPAMPTWMGAVDAMGPSRALGAGIVLAAANPKNLILAGSAALSIAQAGLSAAQQAASYAVFVLIGTVGVAVPIVLYFARGERSAEMLDHIKTWMGRHSHAIMSVICLVIAGKLIGDGVSVLTA